jgi:hypothetical protein
MAWRPNTVCLIQPRRGDMARSKSESDQLPKLIQSIITECGDPVRLLELYYWSTEPDLLPIMRGFASLPSGTRSKLGAFIRNATPDGIVAQTDVEGQILLIARSRAPAVDHEGTGPGQAAGGTRQRVAPGPRPSVSVSAASKQRRAAT